MSDIDYEAEVKAVYPDAVIITNTSYNPDGTIYRVRYFIQRDSNMAFTDCEEDEDFLTDMRRSLPCSESDAWKQAYKNLQMNKNRIKDTKEFNEGCSAHLSKYTSNVESNPYPQDSKEFAEWKRGWDLMEDAEYRDEMGVPNF